MIVDDHPLYREGVVSVFSHYLPGVEVLAAPSAEAGLGLMKLHGDLELALIDLYLPGTDGFSALTLYGNACPGVARVLISGQRVTEELVNRAMAAGASGFIPKSLPVGEMVEAVKRILAGDLFVPDLSRDDDVEPPELDSAEYARTTTHRNAHVDIEHLAEALSIRQIEVLNLIGRGLSNKEIARKLDIAERTVKAHATRVFDALGADNRTQAVLAAQRLGLLSA